MGGYPDWLDPILSEVVSPVMRAGRLTVEGSEVTEALAMRCPSDWIVGLPFAILLLLLPFLAIGALWFWGLF